MREIKFWAWDKKNKKMIYDFALTSYGKPFVLQEIASGGVIVMGEPTPLDCVPMLYIGLKDKNGREIYEGDIVKLILKIETFDPEGYYVGERIVEILKEVKISYPLVEWEKPFVITRQNVLVESIEVIGNIYENPELLQGVSK